MVCEALSENKTLASLDISGWRFHLDLSHSEPVVKSVAKFLKNTVLAKINMFDTHFEVKTGSLREERDDLSWLYNKLKAVQFFNNSVEELNLAKVDVILDGKTLKVREFLYLVSFTKLRVLNIFHEYVPEGGHPVHDSSLIQTFEAVKKNFKQLVILKMGNWLVSIQDPFATKEKLKNILKHLQGLKYLILDNYKSEDDPNIKELNSGKSFLINLLVKYIPNLADLSLQSSSISHDEVPLIYRALKHRVARNPINIHTLYMDNNIVQLINEKLESSRTFISSYNQQSGVLNVKQGERRVLGRVNSIFQKQRPF